MYQRPATNVGLPHLLVGHGVLPPVAAAAIVYVTNFEAFFEALDMDPDLLNNGLERVRRVVMPHGSMKSWVHHSCFVVLWL